VAGNSDRGLRADLARIVGVEGVLDPAESAPYGHDASIQRGLRGKPDAVVRPADATAVAGAIRWCYEHEMAVVPRGGGTGLAGGAVPVEGGVVVSLERLARVRGLEPELWRMNVEAGVSTAHVSRLARENGLIFPPDPGASEQSQIGGNVATNAGGPHAFKYGPTGAWVSGLEVVLAPGELASFGSSTRKDASGYDLRGLLVGSEGTLGIITAVRLRLAPAPQLARALVAFLPDLACGQRVLLQLLGSGLQPAVLDFLDSRAFALTARSFPGEAPAAFASSENTGFVFLIELDGSEGEVAEQQAELLEVLAEHEAYVPKRPDATALWRWRDGLNGAIAGVRGGKVSEDICVPPERLEEALQAVYRLGTELSLPACVWGHAGDGILHATFMVDVSSPSELDRGLAGSSGSLALALRLGGSISGEHGVGYVKRAYFGADWDAPAVAAHRHVKQALDPKGLLNPGKKTPLAGTGGRSREQPVRGLGAAAAAWSREP
jgi:FAD/FMN-containing dehydrogenase